VKFNTAGFKDINDAFSVFSNQLQTSVSSGYFTSLIQSYADLYNSPDLISARVTSLYLPAQAILTDSPPVLPIDSEPTKSKGFYSSLF
jgi:hypothetical protein